MKRSLRLFGLAALVALPAAVSAQESTRPVSFGVSGGLSLPVGDFGEGSDAGFNGTAHLMFKPASFTNLSLRADLGYDRFAVKNLDLNTRIISLSGNAIYAFPQTNPGIVRPYVLGGVGGYNAKVTGEDLDGDLDDASTNLGVQGGGGINFQLSGFATFIEAKYVNIFTEGNSTGFIPITFGIRF
ncbi:MAG TPA: outer membrane beta-barrel protein [Gemmatimonas sp.]|nr:outer membrane beta-barrel protein [Gemmatimonas sp.]